MKKDLCQSISNDCNTQLSSSTFYPAPCATCILPPPCSHSLATAITAIINAAANANAAAVPTFLSQVVQLKATQSHQILSFQQVILSFQWIILCFSIWQAFHRQHYIFFGAGKHILHHWSYIRTRNLQLTKQQLGVLQRSTWCFHSGDQILINSTRASKLKGFTSGASSFSHITPGSHTFLDLLYNRSRNSNCNLGIHAKWQAYSMICLSWWMFLVSSYWITLELL